MNTINLNSKIENDARQSPTARIHHLCRDEMRWLLSQTASLIDRAQHELSIVGDAGHSKKDASRMISGADLSFI